MQRSSSSRRLWRRICRFGRDERGVSAVEFALFLPILLALGAGMTEIGRVVSQAVTLEKSLRAGAIYAARGVFPLSAATQTTVENVVKKGDPDGVGGYLIPGWSEVAADLQIQEISFDVNGFPLPVVRLTATVPFVPMLPGLLPIPSFNLVLRHEQAFIGD